MTNRPSRTVLDRLRAVDWSDETSAFGREHSRALLMREFLRRSALWARACGAEEAWPFFDVAEHVDAEVHAPADVAAEVEELVQGLAPESLRTTCRAAVRWACLGDARTESTAGLPDPYEPLLLLFERGGGFYLEEYLDLNGVMIPLGTVETNASVPPFLTLAPATLDALDAEGEITYYAKIDERHPRQSPRASSDVGSTRTGPTTRRSPATFAGSRPSTSSSTRSATTTSTTSPSANTRRPPSSSRWRTN
ncbi:hypothetical protein [Streptomyces cirratus]|uniref:hypothetical protein n=1 Tax=Streptomyces cirratus TaxID=68187 RepID=UPI00360FC3EB